MKPAEPTFRYPGFKVRALAMAYDLMVIAGYAVVLAIAASVFFRLSSANRLMDSAWKRDAVAFFTLVLPTILYFSFQESSSRQATFGKRKMGLKVIDRNGGRLSESRALLRSGLKFLPWQMAHTAVFQIRDGNTSTFLFAASLLAQLMVILFVLTLLLNKQHRTLYDRLAGSTVIMTGESPPRLSPF